MLVHVHGSRPGCLIHLEPTQWLKRPVQEEPGGEAEVDPRLGENRGGRDGNVTSRLSEFPTASPCPGVFLAPSRCQERGISGVEKVVSTNCWFFPSRSPPPLCQEMGLPGRQHLVLPCKPCPDHKATLALANRRVKRTCVTGS